MITNLKEFKELFLVENLSMEEMSQYFSCSKGTIAAFRKKNNIKKTTKQRYEIQAKKLEKKYGKGCTNPSHLISTIEKRKVKWTKIQQTYPNKELLYNLYIIQNKLLKNVCEDLKLGSNIIKKLLRKYSIKKSKELIKQNRTIGFQNSFSGNTWKDYILPSGKTIRIQGYENKALDILLKIYGEYDILTYRSEMPKIFYFYKGEKHRYYPDFYIPKYNLIIEVKSKYTLNMELEKNLLKEEATKNMKYNYWLMVF